MDSSDASRVGGLRVTRTDIRGPRFPVVDAHNHLSHAIPGGDVTDVGRLLAAMDRAGIRYLVNLDGFWGEYLERSLAKYHDAHPDRFLVFGSVDLADIDRPGFAGRLRRSMRQARERGLSGIKLFKDLSLSYRDPAGELILPSIPLFVDYHTEALRSFLPFGTGTPILPDDLRLRPIWESAAELRLPVLIHIADLAALFDPPDERNEQYALLQRRPQWAYYDKGLPSFQQLLDSQLKLLEQNPDTTFIFAHVGSWVENLAWVSRMLSSYRNAYVDIAARAGELGRQPYTARRFFLEHQDRILFGTDRYPQPTEEYLPWSGISAIYRFLETFDEYFEPDIPRNSPWRLYGIGLPEEVLRKVYHENAQRIIPGISI